MLAGSVRRSSSAGSRRTDGGSETRCGRVERGDERVCLLEVEDPPGARAAGHQSAKRPVTRSRIAVRKQELPHLRRLALQHLRHQISRDASLAAGEVAHESLRVRMPVEEIAASRRPATQPSVRS